MALGFPVILQIVGYQNSGKTTVITNLLENIVKKEIRTGVIKHHGHNDDLSFHDSGKDTERHRNAGAIVTTITSANHTFLSSNEMIPLKKAIEIYKILDVECLLIEGYKQIQYPRVVLCKNIEDVTLINDSTNIIAVISEEAILKNDSIPFYLWKEEQTWLSFLLEYITTEVAERKRCGNEIV
jgi:molybdopterin-guanine dinucleotide biosynthesis protein B